jgi:hypothetical protein
LWTYLLIHSGYAASGGECNPKRFKPEGEHKCGEFKFGRKTIRWNIPYFFKYLGRGKKHTEPLTPEDPTLTTRFLEIWIAGEYRRQR